MKYQISRIQGVALSFLKDAHNVNRKDDESISSENVWKVWQVC